MSIVLRVPDFLKKLNRSASSGRKVDFTQIPQIFWIPPVCFFQGFTTVEENLKTMVSLVVLILLRR